MVHPSVLRPEAVEEALANSAHRRILVACIRRPLPVRELSAACGLPLASAYRQVHALVEGGVLVVERSAMTPDGKPYDLYRSRVRIARLELGPDGTHVTWEPNMPVEDRVHALWDQLGARP